MKFDNVDILDLPFSLARSDASILHVNNIHESKLITCFFPLLSSPTVSEDERTPTQISRISEDEIPLLTLDFARYSSNNIDSDTDMPMTNNDHR